MNYRKALCEDNVEFFHFKPIVCATMAKLRRLNDYKGV